MTTIEFEGDAVVKTDKTDLSLLKIGLKYNIPFIQACKGRSACSTCRIIVLDNQDSSNFLPRNQKETMLALRLGLPDNVRLACQTYIKGDVKVRRLLQEPVDIDISTTRKNVQTQQNVAEIFNDLLTKITSGQADIGHIQNAVILFSDIRNFTTITEKMLPYDLVYVLNRYFYIMSEIIFKHRGYVDKYIGDAIMSIFGIDEAMDEPDVQKEVVLQAIEASFQMLEKVELFNTYIQKNFGFVFKIGIGLHFGEVVLGEIGHPISMKLSAIGDTVNVASRIESACKATNSNLLVSEDMYDFIWQDYKIDKKYYTQFKGKAVKSIIYSLKHRILPKDNMERCRILYHFLEPYVKRNEVYKFLEFSLFTAVDYNAAKKTGGYNGAVRFIDFSKHHSFNIITDTLRYWVSLIQSKYNEQISFSDLIAIGGALAVKVSGGPEIIIKLGRIDSNNPNEIGGMSTIFKKPNLTFDMLYAHISSLGFNLQQMVVLAGIHTLGKSYNGLFFTEDPFVFTNRYFQRLINVKNNEELDESLTFLPSDLVLLDNEESVDLITLYATNQNKFYSDFLAAFPLLTNVGATFKKYGEDMVISDDTN